VAVSKCAGLGRHVDEKEIDMSQNDFTTTITVDQSPAAAFAAINDVRSWWSGDIDGKTDALGAEFTYRYQDFHRSTQRITEMVPERKIVWHVTDSYLKFVDDHTEWNGTDIVFEIEPAGDRTLVRFTHVGLVPDVACYDRCKPAWTHYIADSLRERIAKSR
jgi:hypothetical protein